jgi:hypothetical protein
MATDPYLSRPHSPLNSSRNTPAFPSTLNPTYQSSTWSGLHGSRRPYGAEASLMGNESKSSKIPSRSRIRSNSSSSKVSNDLRIQTSGSYVYNIPSQADQATSPLYDPRYLTATDLNSQSPITFAGDVALPASNSGSKSRSRIGPLFKKFTPRETNSLDLSRSAAENDLNGIYATDFGARSDVDVLTSQRKGTKHTRSTSGTSQFSIGTVSSGYKPSTHYVHPKKHIPRPYTPPLSQSHSTSILDSEHSGEVFGEDDEQLAHRYNTSRSVSINSLNRGQQGRPRTNTDSSARLLHGSHTNLTINPSLLRLSSDPISPTDPISPISRKSIDRPFRTRNKTDDSISFAESVQAARNEWNAKQASKALKEQKDRLKMEEKEDKKRMKREAEASKKNADNEKESSVQGTAYADTKASDPYSTSGTKGNLPSASAGPTQRNGSGGVKMRWTAFVVWLRIRMVNLGRKMGKMF